MLASEQDPAVSEAFSEDDYRRTVNLLEHFYNIVLTDCGTGLMHSAMYGVLGVADQLIIVSSGSIDGARSASATMDWLDAHGHGDAGPQLGGGDQLRAPRRPGGVDLDRVAAHFAARCRAVVQIPFDAHLEEGAEVELDRLEPATRLALLELAAAVADAFDGAPRPVTPAPGYLGRTGARRDARTLSSSCRRNSGSSSGPLTRGGHRPGRPAPGRRAAASALDAVFIAFHSTSAMTAAPMNAMRNNTVEPPPPRG